MTREEIEQKISDNDALIKALQDENKKLRGPKDIAGLVSEPCWDWCHNLQTRTYEPSKHKSMSQNFIWGDLRRVVLRIFSNEYRLKNVRDLSTEQKLLAADCVTEMVRVYNKYFEIANCIDSNEEK